MNLINTSNFSLTLDLGSLRPLLQFFYRRDHGGRTNAVGCPDGRMRSSKINALLLLNGLVVVVWVGPLEIDEFKEILLTRTHTVHPDELALAVQNGFDLEAAKKRHGVGGNTNG